MNIKQPTSIICFTFGFSFL